MKLSLGMVSKHIFLYLCLPDYSHDRTFRDTTSRSDYNLTGECIICPNLDGIERPLLGEGYYRGIPKTSF